MSKLSPGKRDRIQQRAQEWKRFMAGNDKNTPAALAKNRVQHQENNHYNPHDSDRRRRLQLQLIADDNDEPIDRTWRRRVQAQDLAAQEQTEQRQTTLHEMHAPKEDDTAQELQEKRLREAQEDAAAAAAREEQERRRRQQEEKEKALQAEMAAPCSIRPSVPSLPRRRPRRSRKHTRRQRDSSSWLNQLVSVLVAATACCAGDECLGEDDATVAMELETSE